MPHLFEVITVISRSLHQAVGILFIQILPPQVEEQGAVLDLSDELLHAFHQALRVLVLCVSCKSKFCKCVHFIDDARGLFRGAHHVQECFRIHIRTQFAAHAFERGHLLLHIIERALQLRAVEAGEEFTEVPFFHRVRIDRISHDLISPIKVFYHIVKCFRSAKRCISICIFTSWNGCEQCHHPSRYIPCLRVSACPWTSLRSSRPG